MQALRNKERQDETQFITKIDGFLSVIVGLVSTQFWCGVQGFRVLTYSDTLFFLGFFLCGTSGQVESAFGFVKGEHLGMPGAS